MNNGTDFLAIAICSIASEKLLSTLSVKEVGSVGNLFSDRGLKVSKMLIEVKLILEDSSDPTSFTDNVERNFSEAIEQIAIARKSVSLFTKVYALLQSPSILSPEALQALRSDAFGVIRSLLPYKMDVAKS